MTTNSGGFSVNENVGTIIREIPPGQETILDLLDEGGESVRRIEVSHRQLQPEPPVQLAEAAIARAKARNHVFHDIESFTKYLGREEYSGESLALADVYSRKIVCVLSEADPEDRETVAFVATDHPLFKPWQGILNKAIDATEFAVFCQKYRRTIKRPDGRELALLFSQIRMAKTVTVAQGVGKKSLNGVMIEVDIGGNKQGHVVDLPESITVECPLFIGSESLEIDIDLLVDEKQDRVIVYATAPDIEAKQVEAFESLVQVVSQSGVLVGLGVIQHREWETVPVRNYLGK
jgi:hypothetical protein